VRNNVAITGFTSSVPVIQLDQRNWELSAGRAQVTRAELANAGLRDARVMRVAGKADREPVDPDPMAARNRRIEITLLRSDRAAK
jgi:chemotaxis protein MotB